MSLDLNEIIKKSVLEVTQATVSDEVAKGLGAISDKVESLVKEAISHNLPKRIKVTIGEDKSVTIDRQHENFQTLLKYTAAGINTYIVGPAGSGKTHAAQTVAKVLDKPFYSESVSNQSSVSLLKGYMDATGKYVTSRCREAFESGGVYLLDEIDNGNANVIAALNAMMSVAPEEKIGFPDGMVARHKDFIVIACANTFGQGADRQYVGRNQLDAASLDRFAFLEWPYDEKLENDIAMQLGIDYNWVVVVQSVRKQLGELKARHVVSPRATINGGKLLLAGINYKDVLDAVIWKGLDSDIRKKVNVPKSLKKEDQKPEKPNSGANNFEGLGLKGDQMNFLNDLVRRYEEVLRSRGPEDMPLAFRNFSAFMSIGNVNSHNYGPAGSILFLSEKRFNPESKACGGSFVGVAFENDKYQGIKTSGNYPWNNLDNPIDHAQKNWVQISHQDLIEKLRKVSPDGVNKLMNCLNDAYFGIK